MTPLRFSTNSVPVKEQIDAWLAHFGSAFDVTSSSSSPGFEAEASTWAFDGFAFSRVTAPPIRVIRAKANIRREPIDHWSLIVGGKPSRITDENKMEQIIPAGVPFLISMGRESISERASDTRLQLYLPRDNFFHIAPMMDAMQARPLDSPLGAVLAQFMVLLEKRIEGLSSTERMRLSSPIKEMIAACLSNFGGDQNTQPPISHLTKLEQVRIFARSHLRNPSLSVEFIAHNLGISRSALYNLFQDKGGVMQYITHLRLQEACIDLAKCDGAKPIGAVSESLCFQDASTFSRSFKREFGISPKDYRKNRSKIERVLRNSDNILDYIRQT